MLFLKMYVLLIFVLTIFQTSTGLVCRHYAKAAHLEETPACNESVSIAFSIVDSLPTKTISWLVGAVEGFINSLKVIA